jgi:cytochrome c oxidase accessory protein FixG
MVEKKQDFRSILASVDADGKRHWQYVHIVRGAWRFRRQLLTWGLLLFYLALPFLHISANRVLFIDIPHRQYHVLGQVFWPQDSIFLLMGILMALVGTLLLVSLLGRVFCGWLCPHNFTLEFVFRPLELLLEGPAHRRRRQDQASWSFDLLTRKLVKWFLYVMVAWALANTATALFLPTSTYTQVFLFGILVDPRSHPGAFTFWAITTGILLFNFGWFREQTCTIVCPYGRLQSVMLDSDTLVVTYDQQRGEPRGKKKDQTTGDCIDCGMCQQVCPTGIDIRNGNQLECLHCAACIDACDSVMARIDKPLGLIRYSSENALAGGTFTFWRLRQLWYGLVLLALLIVSIVMVSLRTPLKVERLRDRNPAMATSNSAGEAVVRKNFRISVVNRTSLDRQIRLELGPDSPGQLIAQQLHFDLEPSAREEISLFLEIPQQDFVGHKMAIEVLIQDQDGLEERVPLPIRRP